MKLRSMLSLTMPSVHDERLLLSYKLRLLIYTALGGNKICRPLRFQSSFMATPFSCLDKYEITYHINIVKSYQRNKFLRSLIMSIFRGSEH